MYGVEEEIFIEGRTDRICMPDAAVALDIGVCSIPLSGRGLSLLQWPFVVVIMVVLKSDVVVHPPLHGSDVLVLHDPSSRLHL